MSELEQAVPAGAPILIDTSVLVAWIDGREAVSPIAGRLMDDFVKTHRNDGVVSTVSVAEMLIRPSKVGAARAIAMQLLDAPGVVVRNADFLVAAEAARMRAQSTLELPDAIVLATGVMSSTACLVTNDRKLAASASIVVPEMNVCLLSDYV